MPALTALTLCRGEERALLLRCCGSGVRRRPASPPAPVSLPALSHCHRLLLLVLLAGSAMAGLDGLIGAEERVINSKAKISNNVVRARRRLAPPESFFF